MSDTQMQIQCPCRSTIAEIREVCLLLRETTAVTEIDQALEQFASARFVLPILGKAKRGKSTLLNALLGRNNDVLAPIDRLPASNAITRYRWALQESATVVFRDGHRQPISYSEIRDFVTEELNPDNRKQVDVVYVDGPFEGWGKHVELVDTPGAGSMHEHHEALLHAFIPQADAILFLVTARMPLDQDELLLLQKIRKADIKKIFFVINRMDETAPADLQSAIRHNQSLLAQAGFSGISFHCISALRAYRGEWSFSGIQELTQSLQSFLSENSGRVLSDRCLSRVRLAGESVLQRLELALACGHKSSAELTSDMERLAGHRETLTQKQELAQREFELAWQRAIEEFHGDLLLIQKQVDQQLRSWLSSVSTTSISAAARTAPTQISDALDAWLAPRARQLEERLRAAAQKLESEFPRLTITADSTLLLDAPGSIVPVWTATLGGAAAVSSGVGLAAAGSAAAASIAAANAAALSATTTVVVPTALSGTLSSIPWVGGVLSQMATGTATLSTPAALTATPLWVALSGPVGWTLAGIGALAIPLSWWASKLKQRQQLEQACGQQMRAMWDGLRNERLPLLRKLADSIVEEFRLRLERQLEDVECTLRQLREQRPDPAELEKSAIATERLRSLLFQLVGVGNTR